MTSQSDAPLVKALQDCTRRRHTAFYTPGHKRGQGISPLHQTLFGSDIFQVDVPELPGLDDLFAPEAVILEAQHLAAQAFGADQTCFLVNGSTCGVEAALLAICGPGDQVLVPRNAHQSVLSGLILSGAMPVWITPEYEPEWQLFLGVTAATIAAILKQNPNVKAVLVVSPTYEGVCSDLAAIAAVVHAYDLPLIVDAAHGPHLIFHPDLPPSALSSGADIVIHSVHKVLSAFTQAAMLHSQGNRVDLNRLRQALRITQSSSPSYLLLGSLDAARHQMANHGYDLMERTLELSTQTRRQLAEQGIPVLNIAQVSRDSFQQDLTRLTVDVSIKGMTGFEADTYLHARGVTAELPTWRLLTFIVSLGNSSQDVRSLVQGLSQLPIKSITIKKLPYQLTKPVSAMSPRDAFFSATTICSMEAAIGQVSADTVCMYPPGIPSLMPGETITSEAVHQLSLAQSAGAHVTGLADVSLQTLRVVQTDKYPSNTSRTAVSSG
ncbi:MAG: aminotransferase class I/II-fold pyridoxal phosphate-dependent enzyme [Cyanobacteria bacterium P01_D01_bin.156]